MGASLVRVQRVHLYPLRFAMGAMHPSSEGLFALRTENQGKIGEFVALSGHFAPVL